MLCGLSFSFHLFGCFSNFTRCFYHLQALPNRKEALIVSCWPQTSLPRDGNSVKRFENLQALVSAKNVFLLFPEVSSLARCPVKTSFEEV